MDWILQRGQSSEQVGDHSELRHAVRVGNVIRNAGGFDRAPSRQGLPLLLSALCIAFVVLQRL